VTEVVALPAPSIRARARPGAVVAIWAWETVLGIVGSWSTVALVRGAYGRHPAGDATLWDPGALPLLGMLMREANGVRGALGAAGAMLVLAAFAGLVPLAALMVSMANATRDGRGIGTAPTIEGAIRRFRPFATMLLITGIGQVLAVAMAVLFGQGARGWTSGWLGEARSQEVGIAVGTIPALAAVAMGLVQDLGRAAVVRLDVDAVRALVLGARALRSAPVALPWAWAWRLFASLAPVAFVAALAERLGGRAGWALVVLALLHQVVVLVRVALRASWLAKALRTMGATGALGQRDASER
jgi:hypothetical protein